MRFGGSSFNIGNADSRLMYMTNANIVCRSIPVLSKLFLLAKPFWLRKRTTDSHILAGVNIDCPDDRYPKLKIYISVPSLGSHEYIPIAYVIMTLIKLIAFRFVGTGGLLGIVTAIRNKHRAI
jgi:hypothetical protein